MSQETRENISKIMEMMYECVPYCYKQGKDPSDGKILAEFLATKGLKTLKFLENENVKCGVAEFLLSANKAVRSTGTGIPPLITIAYGLAIIDLIEVGNSCEFAQKSILRNVP